MADVTQLNSSDVGEIAGLLSDGFEEEPWFRFVFRTLGARQRWLRKLWAAQARMTVGYGQATGIRAEGKNDLIAVALWYLPTRRFPPPYYRCLVPSLPIIPMMLELPTYCRLSEVNRFCLSLVPRQERFLYLATLAVKADSRNMQLGTQLIQWGKQYAQNANCRVFLNCWSPLVPYYERLDFAPVFKRSFRGIEDEYYGLVWPL